MASRDQHVRQAAHNERVAAVLELAAVPDWEITALFYACLHYVDALLAPQHPRTHAVRNRVVASDQRLSAHAHLYLELADRSRDARYSAQLFAREQRDDAHENLYAPFRNVIRNRLGLD